MNRGIRNWRAVTPALALVTALVLNAPGLARAQPQVKGQWVTVLDPTGSGDLLMPINPVHTGLLRTGKVLVIAGSGNYPKDSVDSVYKATVWDPVGGTIAPVQLTWDLFCNGMSFLPDGRALITGGSKPYPTNVFKGLKNTTIFDPITSIFHRVEDMADGRWYPTNIALPVWQDRHVFGRRRGWHQQRHSRDIHTRQRMESRICERLARIAGELRVPI